MIVKICISVLVLFCIVDIALACNGVTIKQLYDLERRARNYKADSPIEGFISDFIISDEWYSVIKFNEQYIMPDSSKMPDYFSCGTNEVIYLEGVHPDVATLTATPVDANACLRDTFEDCAIRYPIQIRKCGAEIQYFLVPTKQYSAYCFDPPAVQEITDILPPPSDVHLGAVTVKPKLVHDKENKKLIINEVLQDTINFWPHLEFHCSFETQNDYFYSVSCSSQGIVLRNVGEYHPRYMNGNYFLAFGPTDKVDELIVTEQMLLDHNKGLGYTMKCGVRVSQDEAGQSTPIESSPDYFAGIKILNPNIVMEKNDITNVEMQLTVPVGCRYNSHNKDKPCVMPLSLFDPTGYSCGKTAMVPIKNSKRCGTDIKSLKDGESLNGNDVYTFQATTKDVNYADGKHYTLHLRTEDDVEHKLWRNYHPDYINIIVTNEKSNVKKMCYSHVDPHMRTSDGYYFDNQNLGDFLLYRNTEYGIEVQERLVRCNGNRATCTCGVAIRAGADVFMINLCGRVSFIDFKECGDGGILHAIQKTSRLIKVYTPIGTAINIKLLTGKYSKTMNVDIYMAPKDFKKTEGLCGFFDGDKTNDLKKRNKDQVKIDWNPFTKNIHNDFSLDWRLKPDENLFKTSNHLHDKWENKNGKYCICEQALPESTAAPSRIPEAKCYDTQYFDCLEYDIGSLTEKKCNKIRRFKRSSGLSKHEKEVQRLLRKSDEEILHPKQKRAASEYNITEDEALAICGDSINGSLVMTEFPEQAGGENPNAVIEQCVFDVTIGNDKEWAGVHVDALNSIVSKEFERDPEYVANNTDSVHMFIKNSCPNNCSERGQCSDNGQCLCELHYHGSDCSIDERIPVDVLDVEGGGVCDLAEGDDCVCLYVYADNILHNFTCEISGKMIYTNGGSDVIAPLTIPGIYEDIFTGQCCVPDNREERSADQSDQSNIFSKNYEIKVSNDGQHFGHPMSAFIFNSMCQEVMTVGSSNIVILKKENCFIDGTCVTEGESSFADECMVCQSNFDAYSWTQTCLPSTDQGSSKLDVILGCSLGIGLSMVVIAVAYVLWRIKIRSNMKKRKSVGNSQTYLDVEFRSNSRAE